MCTFKLPGGEKGNRDPPRVGEKEKGRKKCCPPPFQMKYTVTSVRSGLFLGRGEGAKEDRGGGAAGRERLGEEVERGQVGVRGGCGTKGDKTGGGRDFGDGRALTDELGRDEVCRWIGVGKGTKS